MSKVAYLNNETDYGWYLCLDENKIVGGLGVIGNDFHNRKNLAPNVQYIQKKNIAVKELQTTLLIGITPIYLITDHTGLYERYD